MADEILYEVRGQCAVITINRPAQRNAINSAACQQLTAAFQRFDADPELRVAILTGAGDVAFSAGRDLKEIASGAPVAPLPVLGDTVQTGKPVIAAVNGAAIGGGWLFAQMCDLCVAADHAKFAISEGRFGRAMGWCAPLVHMVGSRVAMELMLTGKTIDAARAHAIGFVNRVVPREALMAEAMAMADEISASAPLAVAAGRRMVSDATNMGVAAALMVARQLCEELHRGEDAREGARAFKEKRPPIWTGR